MKIKLGIFLFALVSLIFACKQNDTDEKTVQNEVEVIKTDSVIPNTTIEKKDTQRIWKVNIGLLPDVEYKGVGIKAGLIRPGQEAEKAGLKVGDIVIELDGKKVKTMQEYTMFMGKFQKGESVEMTVLRGNQTIKKKLTFD